MGKQTQERNASETEEQIDRRIMIRPVIQSVAERQTYSKMWIEIDKATKGPSRACVCGWMRVNGLRTKKTRIVALHRKVSLDPLWKFFEKRHYFPFFPARSPQTLFSLFSRQITSTFQDLVGNNRNNKREAEKLGFLTRKEFVLVG